MKKQPLKLSQEEKNKILNLHESYKNNPTPTLSESTIIGQTLYANLLSEQPYDCGDKCAHRPREPKAGEMVTAVMSVYFDGKQCRNLSYGGGAFRGSNGMAMCQECCESRTKDTDEEVQYVEKIDIPSHYHDCVTWFQTSTGVYARCKYGTANLPIGTITIGDYITIEDCCRQGNVDIDIDIDDEGPDGTRKRKKCVWIREPLDEPTLDNNGKSINNIRICHKGEKVEMIQEVLLKVIGCDLGKSGPNKDGVDGLFGSKTRKCVKRYQEQFDLEVDGIVGNETWTHMFPDADISITGSTEDVVSGQTVDQMTDIEIDAFIDEVKGEILPKKKCLALIVSTSKMIKKRPAEVDKLKGDESLILTLGNCLNDHNFPLIAGHRKRVKKTFGLKGKGN